MCFLLMIVNPGILLWYSVMCIERTCVRFRISPLDVSAIQHALLKRVNSEVNAKQISFFPLFFSSLSTLLFSSSLFYCYLVSYYLLFSSFLSFPLWSSLLSSYLLSSFLLCSYFLLYSLHSFDLFCFSLLFSMMSL